MEKLSAKFKLNDTQLAALRQIVPEAFKDNELDFNSLYEALCDYIDDDEPDIEQYGLSWPGKREAKRAAAIPPIGTLVPVPGDGVDEASTKNIYIEGDNLEVLKIIRKAYEGRIKMIYIDPPYNTGNDFIYPDDFSESVESYQRRTGQIDESGARMTTNNRSDGRFHSKWLSMMYPRLRLVRDLLSEDGVIFISIDDNEVDNLKKNCNEIFGEENFIVDLIWANKEGGGSSDSKLFRIKHEHILCYSNNFENVEINGVSISNAERYKSEDIYVKTRGKYYLQKLGMGSIQYSSSLDYPIITPDGTSVLPADNNNGKKACWRWSKSKYDWGAKNGFIEIKKDGKGTWIIYTKQYINCDNEGNIITRTQRPMGIIDKFSSTQASKFMENIGLGSVFIYSKPVELVEYLLSLLCDNALILDFFSGSSTTAHAMMKLNAEDGGNRQFIMVQLPEICKEDSEAAKAGFKNICEIGKERIRRAGKKIRQEAGLNAGNIDTGFKVFRLAPSNYRAWTHYKGTDIKQLEELFKEDSLKQGWKEDDLITEVMLIEGFPLDSKIETLPQFKKNKVRKISSDFHENTIYICLDKEIHKETVSALNLSGKDRFICLDSAVDDESKIRLEDKNFIRTL